MAYLLEFPPRRLPSGALSPPYIVVGIRGTDITALLPPRIPLNAALHFVPKLQQWVLPTPPPPALPWPLAHRALREPKVGIDILQDGVEAEGLEWIMSRILQVAGIAHPKSLFLLNPTLETSISIHKTWLALDLPLAGIANLHHHCVCTLMLGPAVTLSRMKDIWDIFPHDSDIVREMGLNFIRSQIDFVYTAAESSRVKDWYLQSGELCRFFQSLEGMLPKSVEMKVVAIVANAADGMSEGTRGKPKTVVEKKKVCTEEKKDKDRRHQKRMEMMANKAKPNKRLRSIKTGIWDPPAKDEKKDAKTDDKSADKNLLPWARNLSRPEKEAGAKTSSASATSMTSVDPRNSIRWPKISKRNSGREQLDAERKARR
jgi:hypothetical protein